MSTNAIVALVVVALVGVGLFFFLRPSPDVLAGPGTPKAVGVGGDGVPPKPPQKPIKTRRALFGIRIPVRR